jgi:hypothetical protein
VERKDLNKKTPRNDDPSNEAFFLDESFDPESQDFDLSGLDEAFSRLSSRKKRRDKLSKAPHSSKKMDRWH